MSEWFKKFLANRFVQYVFGGAFLTLLADLTDTFHTEDVVASAVVASGKCDSIGAAIVAIFTGGC